jgi:hypothetical protein
MQMMYKLDQHPSYDKVTADIYLRTEKDIELIVINNRALYESFTFDY